jgi:pyrroloquinoline-quinone synthase
MTTALKQIEELVERKALLKHSFYTRWVAGTLPREALTEYARQYYRFEAAFPRVLSAIHTQLDELEDRQIVLENLWDEEHGAEPHVELWLRFADAVGASRQDVPASPELPSTAALVRVYRELAASSPAEGLAALFAYESQVPDVALAKLEGLARHYGLVDGPGLDFWKVHHTLDVEHAGAESELLARHAGPKAVEAARKALDAWHDFLSGVENASA